MIVPVMAISNLVLTQQIYSEERNGAHAHYREPVPLMYSKSFFFHDLLVTKHLRQKCKQNWLCGIMPDQQCRQKAMTRA